MERFYELKETNSEKSHNQYLAVEHQHFFVKTFNEMKKFEAIFGPEQQLELLTKNSDCKAEEMTPDQCDEISWQAIENIFKKIPFFEDRVGTDFEIKQSIKFDHKLLGTVELTRIDDEERKLVWTVGRQIKAIESKISGMPEIPQEPLNQLSAKALHPIKPTDNGHFLKSHIWIDSVHTMQDITRHGIYNGTFPTLKPLEYTHQVKLHIDEIKMIGYENFAEYVSDLSTNEDQHLSRDDFKKCDELIIAYLWKEMEKVGLGRDKLKELVEVDCKLGSNKLVIDGKQVYYDMSEELMWACPILKTFKKIVE